MLRCKDIVRPGPVRQDADDETRDPVDEGQEDDGYNQIEAGMDVGNQMR